MMRIAGVVFTTLLMLPACGEDEIVSRAREKESEKATKAPTASAAPVATTADTPKAGAGVPEAPKPGIPAEPTPAAPGSPQPGTPDKPTPGAAGAPQPGVAGAGAVGVPGEPTPGVPDQPKPGVPSQPPPGQGGTMQQLDGPAARLRGTIIFSAYTGGSVRVDAFDGDHSRPGTHPRIVATARLDRPGPFELLVPLQAGKVYIEASIDEDADGRPGPQDPQGTADRYPVTVSGDVSGLSVTLSKREPPPGGKNKDDF